MLVGAPGISTSEAVEAEQDAADTEPGFPLILHRSLFSASVPIRRALFCFHFAASVWDRLVSGYLPHEADPFARLSIRDFFFLDCGETFGGFHFSRLRRTNAKVFR